MTPSQESFLVSLWESDDFRLLLDELQEPEITRKRKRVADFLAEGNMAKACLAMGALQVWESEFTDVLKFHYNKILKKQKGTEQPRG